MVNSLINPAVNYNESPDIDTEDLDHDANLYETNIYEKATVFALGKPKYTYVDKNIVYYSIYLVEHDEITMQIGVYEITANEQETIFDKEGDIDLNKFAKPLLFAFTYKALHLGANASLGIGTTAHANASIGTTTSKSKNQAAWIQEFMYSDKYDIIDTKSDGNCFFSVVQLALAENDQDISIDDMRDILVENATEDLFQNYKSLYESLVDTEANLTREIKNISKRYKDLTATMKKTKDRNLITGFEKQSNTIKKIHTDLKNDRKQVVDNINTECGFMKGIDNLSMLKLKMKTNEYWANAWAISVLERELNIKIIIFSELNYRENDVMNVLQCGQLDEALEAKGIFEPAFYVLAAYHGGYHYQLITYNNLKSFLFAELPEEVRQLVVEKCLEKNAGPYSIIPEFTDYAFKAQAPADVQGVIEPILITSDKSTHASASKPASLEELSSDLYDNGTVLRFYSNSSGTPLPGKGSGETLGPEGPKAYEELARIPDWRKKLANSWPAELKIDNHTWLSVEHYYQASKFKRNNKAFYLQFSLDSPDSSIAKDLDLAKAAGSKSGKFKGEVVRPKTVSIDPDFFAKPNGSNYSRGEIEFETAIRAKFSQHPELKELLLATQKAKLEHTLRGKPAEVVQELMRVRRELKEAI